jgi:hypothetical protein
MTRLALALATALVLGSISTGIAGESSPDLAVPSAAPHHGVLTVAPLAARDEGDGSFRAPTAAENAWMDRASQKQGD